MTNYIITSDQHDGSGSDGQDIGNADTVFIKQGALLSGDVNGIYDSNGYNTINVYGGISASNYSGYGIEVGGSSTVTVGTTGYIRGEYGVVVTGEYGTVVNNGEIDSYYFGIKVATGENIVMNGGAINSNIYGIYSNSSTGTDYIENSGSIEALVHGMYFAGTTTSDVTNSGSIYVPEGDGVAFGGGSTCTLINTGSIVSEDGPAVTQLTGTSTLIIHNSGTISGNISFGDGDDSYLGVQGSVYGLVSGHGGDDVLKSDTGSLSGGDGSDTLKAPGSDDVTLNGGAAADQLYAGVGDDTFIYAAVSDSTSTHYDTIHHFDADRDQFGLPSVVKGMGKWVTSGELRTGSHFDTDLAAAIGSAQLKAHYAVLFTPSSGALAGHTFLIVDANGTAGYQASADYVIELLHGQNLGDLSKADFFQPT